MVLDKIKLTNQTHQLISPGDTIIVGLSGGPDSLALTFALLELREEMNLRIVIVHINHLLRGEAADLDEVFVKTFAESHSLSYYAFREDIKLYAKRHKCSLEEAGRNIRYQRFFDIMKKENANKIAVAHNKNDLVETFLINLMRGADINGLASIAYKTEKGVIRPLLDTSRDEIEAYCHEKKLHPRKDASNDTNDYTRNKVRHLLVPLMKENFNRSIEETLYRSIIRNKEALSFWDEHIEKLFARFTDTKHYGVCINKKNMDNLTLYEQDQLIRRMVYEVRKSLKDVYSDLGSRVRSLTQTGTHVDIDSNFMIYLNYEELVFTSKNYFSDSNESIPKIYVKKIPVDEAFRYRRDQNQVHVDGETIVGSLYVRHRKSGDVLRPLGMKGHKKIKDIFIDKKIPKFSRDSIWLVCDDDKIIWIPGIQMTDTCKITKKTKYIMIIGFEDIVECV